MGEKNLVEVWSAEVWYNAPGENEIGGWYSEVNKNKAWGKQVVYLSIIPADSRSIAKDRCLQVLNKQLGINKGEVLGE